MIRASRGDIPCDILEEIIALGEGYKTEFKVTLPSPKSLARSLCAFANAKGGTLFVGIDDSGVPVGITNRAIELSTIEKAVPLVLPKPVIKVSVLTFNDRDLLYIEVSEGPNKPYYVRDGKETSAYIRAADVNLPATKKILRHFMGGDGGPAGARKTLRKHEKIIHDLFDQNKRLGVSDIREALNYSERRIKRILVSLTRQGLIIPSYNEKNVYYRTEDR
ncbi:MAG: ATP-binding protein [Spirochaetes bacterium]|nr:ATP-binding protein [Spirochaetota bacterium]